MLFELLSAICINKDLLSKRRDLGNDIHTTNQDAMFLSKGFISELHLTNGVIHWRGCSRFQGRENEIAGSFLTLYQDNRISTKLLLSRHWP